MWARTPKQAASKGVGMSRKSMVAIVGTVVAVLVGLLGPASARVVAGDGQLTFFTDTDVILVGLDGAVDRVEIPEDLDSRDVAESVWLPDGQTLVHTGRDANGVPATILWDTTDGNVETVAWDHGDDPAPSPAWVVAIDRDGSRIVVVVVDENGFGVAVVDVATGHLEMVDVPSEYAGSIAADFAENGSVVLFAAAGEGSSLWTWTSDTGVEPVFAACGPPCANLGSNPHSLAVDRFGRILHLSDNRSAVFELDPLEIRVEDHDRPVLRVLSPSETRLASVVAPADGPGSFRILVDDLTAGTTLDLPLPTDVPGTTAIPLWRPDGAPPPLAEPVVLPRPHPGFIGPVLPDGDPMTDDVLAAPDPASFAVEVSRLRYPADHRAAHVVIARDDVFADALAGAPLLADGPLLFARSGTSYDAATLAEIDRVLTEDGQVIVLGGTAAIEDPPPGIPRDRIVRFAGDNRVSTSFQIAQHVARNDQGPPATELFVATADNWPDSIVAGAVAARRRIPILLAGANNGTLMVQIDAMHIDTVHILGGTSAVTAAAADAAARAPSVDEVFRHAGPSRVETGHAVNAAFPPDANDPLTYLVADAYANDTWAYMLAGTSIAAAQGSGQALGNIGIPCTETVDIALIGHPDRLPTDPCTPVRGG